MTYVTEQTPAQLRAHMKRLKAMSGWHEPLAERLYAEIVTMDAEIDRLRTQNQALVEAMDSQKNEWLSLHEKRQQLEKNAERYVWLRDNFTRLIINTTPVCLGETEDFKLITRTRVQYIDVNENFRLTVPESVDQSVDEAKARAALAQAEGGV